MARTTAIDSETVELLDGRTVTVRLYPDHSIRVTVRGINGFRYVMSECFLPGAGQDAIVKLEAVVKPD